ncbi:hypothetical protein [Methanolacinia paynteri]|uniref:hypothetical protein n=1 Tax=Methanolacinia paynteri TaxID=230356 RepID=UPI00064E9E9F|nr:hypothetical protein [Methanolacinia paynteri]
MKILETFEIEDCSCIEPTLMDHLEDRYTDMAVMMAADEARLLIDEKEDPVALALHDSKNWFVSSYIFREPELGVIEKFEECGGDIYQENRDDYTDSIREYYCLEMVKEFPGVLEDNRPGRDILVRELLEEVFGSGCIGMKTATDFCCGSGVATSVLNDMGKDTLSFDLDASLISLGVQKKRLDPKRAMCIDGRAASVFCPESDLCLALMLGDINNMNYPIWECMIGEILAIGKKSLISVATERESKMVEKWLEEEDASVTSFENTCDPIYDRFVLVAE